MQFALHYMGQTEQRMRRFLNEVSRHLRVGGIFIATTMDSRVLMQLLMGHAERSWVSLVITYEYTKMIVVGWRRFSPVIFAQFCFL